MNSNVYSSIYNPPSLNSTDFLPQRYSNSISISRMHNKVPRAIIIHENRLNHHSSNFSFPPFVIYRVAKCTLRLRDAIDRINYFFLEREIARGDAVAVFLPRSSCRSGEPFSSRQALKS